MPKEKQIEKMLDLLKERLALPDSVKIDYEDDRVQHAGILSRVRKIIEEKDPELLTTSLRKKLEDAVLGDRITRVTFTLPDSDTFTELLEKLEHFPPFQRGGKDQFEVDITIKSRENRVEVALHGSPTKAFESIEGALRKIHTPKPVERATQKSKPKDKGYFKELMSGLVAEN